MNEWMRVKAVPFTNHKGVTTQVKLQHKFEKERVVFEVDADGRQADLIAFQHMRTELETLRFVECNATKYAEYNYDKDRVGKVNIPG